MGVGVGNVGTFMQVEQPVVHEGQGQGEWL